MSTRIEGFGHGEHEVHTGQVVLTAEGEVKVVSREAWRGYARAAIGALGFSEVTSHDGSTTVHGLQAQDATEAAKFADLMMREEAKRYRGWLGDKHNQTDVCPHTGEGHYVCTICGTNLIPPAPEPDPRTAPTQDPPAYSPRDRLADIVDEAFGPQPVMGMDELLTLLEERLGEWDRQRAAVLAIADDCATEGSEHLSSTARLIRQAMGVTGG